MEKTARRVFVRVKCVCKRVVVLMRTTSVPLRGSRMVTVQGNTSMTGFRYGGGDLRVGAGVGPLVSETVLCQRWLGGVGKPQGGE